MSTPTTAEMADYLESENPGVPEYKRIAEALRTITAENKRLNKSICKLQLDYNAVKCDLDTVRRNLGPY